MKDVHVHLENGPYTKEWLEQFIEQAIQRNLEEIWFLEHTHLFLECRSLYKEMAQYNTYQKEWFRRKAEQAKPLQVYTDFIREVKKEEYPVKLSFGLEVCYSPEHETEIAQLRADYPFDFLVGSVHFIDGWAFSHLRQPWRKEDYDTEDLYRRYYGLLLSLTESGLFSGLAHPNSLQCFGAWPEEEKYADTYLYLAEILKRQGMYIEESSGLYINYGDKRPGMNPLMLNTMQSSGVSICTASDAHVPSDVGRGIPEMMDLMQVPVITE